MRTRTALVGILAVGSAAGVAAVLLRRGRNATRGGSYMHRSRLRRNGQLARIGARVGTTYATTAAQEDFRVGRATRGARPTS